MYIISIGGLRCPSITVAYYIVVAYDVSVRYKYENFHYHYPAELGGSVGYVWALQCRDQVTCGHCNAEITGLRVRIRASSG